MINRGYSNVAYLEAALQFPNFRIGDPRLKNETELLADELMHCEAEMACNQKIAQDLQIHADHTVHFNTLLKRRLHDMGNARMEDSGQLHMLTNILWTELRDDDNKLDLMHWATMGMWQETAGNNAGCTVPQNRLEAEVMPLSPNAMKEYMSMPKEFKAVSGEEERYLTWLMQQGVQVEIHQRSRPRSVG